jgi:hypothetical protein
MTRKQKILHYLQFSYIIMSCQDITDKIIKEEKLTGNVAKYLSGSISSILAKLVKDGVLKYAEGKGPRGGHLYQKNLNLK